MKKLLVIFLVLSSLPFALQAQFVGATPGGNPFTRTLSPLNFNLQTGMNVGTSRFGNYMQSYLSPSLMMPINKKLSISAGVTYSYMHLNNAPVISNTGELQSFSGGLNTLTMFTSGAYKVNDKLTVTGSAFKTINPAFEKRLNPNQLSMEAQGVSVGFGYRLSDKVHIGGEIRMQQGNSNLYNPFNNGYYGNPFMLGY